VIRRWVLERKGTYFSFRGPGGTESPRAVSMAVLWKPGSAAHSFPEWNFHASYSMSSKKKKKKPAGILSKLGLYHCNLLFRPLRMGWGKMRSSLKHRKKC
jgi:hypothetical protein